MADNKKDITKKDPTEAGVKFNLDIGSKEVVGSPEKITEEKELFEEPKDGGQKNLKDELSAIDFSDSPKAQSVPPAKDLKTPIQQEKIQKLLRVAEDKGVVYAVAMAKKLDDPYILDMFHDALAENGFYKKFKQ